VQALLAKGAEVDIKDARGQTALIGASYNGHIDVVHALLAKGADVNIKNINGGTALDAAKSKGYMEIVHLLDKTGATPTESQNSQTSSTVTISERLAESLLLEKNRPVYPSAANKAGVYGTVVLQVTVSKTGAVENLIVVSGPPMLRQAALDAVTTWRFKPYLINNDPAGLKTTVKVTFAPRR
jgi:TonB family protein